MDVEMTNGYSMEIGHYPGRKKPLIVLSVGGKYLGHAVFSNEESMEAFKEFFKKIWEAR